MSASACAAAFLLPLVTAKPVSRRFYVDACANLDAGITGRTPPSREPTQAERRGGCRQVVNLG